MEFQIRKPLVNTFRFLTDACTSCVILSRSVCQLLLESVALADNRYESGGLLLGHRWGRCFYITDTTCAPPCPDNTLTDFFLDGEYHLQAALSKIERFAHPPRVLGVWHSHICDGDHLSRQDQASNLELARHLHGTLSMIAYEYSAPDQLQFAVWYISESGRERRLRVLPESREHPLPPHLL